MRNGRISISSCGLKKISRKNSKYWWSYDDLKKSNLFFPLNVVWRPSTSWILCTVLYHFIYVSLYILFSIFLILIPLYILFLRSIFPLFFWKLVESRSQNSQYARFPSHKIQKVIFYIVVRSVKRIHTISMHKNYPKLCNYGTTESVPLYILFLKILAFVPLYISIYKVVQHCSGLMIRSVSNLDA